MHQDCEFKIYNNINNYDAYVRKYVTPLIPAVYRDLRIRYLDEIYHLISLIYYAAYNRGNIRRKYIVDILVSISLLDHLSRRLLEDLAKARKYLVKSIGMLTHIKNMCYAWRSSNEESL